MKVAEIFADLGFKVQGAEELKSFETTLQSIAGAARDAVQALKALASAPVPRRMAQVTKHATSAAVRSPVVQAAVKPVVRVVIDQNGKIISAQKSPTGSQQSQPAATSVPNIPPGVYGQNVLQGPTPPSHVPPPLNQPNVKQGNSLPVAVLQGFKALGSLGLKVFGITTVAMALKKLVSALAEMVRTSMQAAFTMDKFTYQTGMSRRELKEWSRVAALSDVREEDLQDSLKRMQQLSRQIRYTGEGATPFLQLGIDPMASPSKILKQFAERTRHMDTATAVYWGSLIGLSDNMVYMLRKNADKLGSLFSNAQLSDEEYQKVTQLSVAWKNLTYTMGLLGDKITSDIAPAINWIVDKATMVAQLLTQHKELRMGSMNVLQAAPNALTSVMLPVGVMRMMGARGGNTHIENNVDVKVDGSGRPNDTARAIGTEFDRRVQKAYYGSQASVVFPQP